MEFSTPGMRAPLQPYFELTTAVRSGDLATFQTVTEKCTAVFKEDKTINLITRLHHNVIRTGLRRINLAYSRISLKVSIGWADLADVPDMVPTVSSCNGFVWAYLWLQFIIERLLWLFGSEYGAPTWEPARLQNQWGSGPKRASVFACTGVVYGCSLRVDNVVMFSCRLAVYEYCSLPFSTIALVTVQDVAEKLHLPSAEDAEFICAKAIRDGALDAVLDHAGAFLASREVADVYSTQEPQVG